MKRLVAFAAVLAVPAVTDAVPMTIDITGVVSLYQTFDGVEVDLGVDALGTLSSLDASGSITYDLDLAPPAETDEFATIFTYEHVSTGPPLDEFVSGSVSWDNGTFVTDVVPGAASVAVGDAFRLRNRGPTVFPDPGEDELLVLDGASWQEGTVVTASELGFFFREDFLAEGAGFPIGNELPNFDTATGWVVFQSLIVDSTSGVDLITGYRVRVDVESASIHATQVPAPPAAGLLISGLAALSFHRRRVRAPRKRRIWGGM